MCWWALCPAAFIPTAIRWCAKWWKKAGWGWDAPAPFAPGRKLGEALLTPTRLYVRSALEALRVSNIKDGGIKGFAHITGGGITENLPRALPQGLDAQVDLDCWTPPPVFGWLAKAADIAPLEMLRTFNCGIGLVAVVAEKSAGHVIDAFQTCGDKALRLGHLVPGTNERALRRGGRGQSGLSRKSETLKVGVLISGRGSNLGALIDAADGYDIVLVISNNEGAGGLQRAAEAGIATLVIAHKGKTREAFDAELDAALRGAGVEIVCLAGFMRILSDGFTRRLGRKAAQHPSLAAAGL